MPLLLLTTSLAFAARLPTLTRHQVVEGDGVHYASLARDTLAGDLSGVSNPYWSSLWPAAIAAVSLGTGLDVVEAGRFTSFVSGVVASALALLLGTQLLGSTSGLAAGLAVAAHPWLILFSTLVFTESFFTCLQLGLLLAGWNAAVSGKHSDLIASALLAALAALTRPESLAAIAIVVGLIAGRHLRERGLGLAVRSAGLVLLIVALSLGGRAGLCHRYYKVWDFGVETKATNSLFIGMADTWAEKERLISEITPSGENKLAAEARKTSVLGFALANPRLLAAHCYRNAARIAVVGKRVLAPVPANLGRSAFGGKGWGRLLSIAAFTMLVLMLVGLGTALAHRETRLGAAFVLAVAGLHLLGILPLDIFERRTVNLVPFGMLFLGHGLAVTLQRTGERTASVGVGVLLVAMAGLSARGVAASMALAQGDDPPSQREAALWIQGRFGQGIRVMTPSPAISFYLFDSAHKDHAEDMPWLDGAELIDFARERNVQIVAAPEWYLLAVAHPAADLLLEPERASPSLEFLATVGERAPERVFIYRLRPA